MIIKLGEINAKAIDYIRRYASFVKNESLISIVIDVPFYLYRLSIFINNEDLTRYF